MVGGCGGVGGGGIPSDYFVSTQLQLCLFCCWGCRFCWAVTISEMTGQKISINTLQFWSIANW